jgi:transposase
MNIIGCDLHTRYQVVAWVNEETGEIMTRRLGHENGEARAFYTHWPSGARVGIEATFPALWFERLLAECGHELWVGDAAQIRARQVRAQKTDTRDAEHLLDLLLHQRFPRLWIPAPAERDLRQLLVHRVKLVRLRTAVKNQLQAMALSHGVCRRWKLWSSRGRGELQNLPLLPWASRRRQELLQWLDQGQTALEPLDQAVQQEAQRRPEAVRLMTHPGVGPVVALAFVLTLGPVERFAKPPAGELSGSESARALHRNHGPHEASKTG